MADGIYVGMAAASARSAQLDAISDNLANAETPGFKASRPAFQAFMPAQAAPGTANKVLSAAVAGGIDLRPGVITPTDVPLDVTPDADTFLAVQTPQNQRAFTRNGHIEVTPDGQMLIAGNQLIGASGGPVRVPPGSNPTIRDNGDIVVGRGDVVDRVALFRLSGPLGRPGPALLAPLPGATVTPAPEAVVRTGQLEAGNASALESTVAMITAQRNFESAMQAIQTYRNLDQKAIDVGRIR